MNDNRPPYEDTAPCEILATDHSEQLSLELRPSIPPNRQTTQMAGLGKNPELRITKR